MSDNQQVENFASQTLVKALNDVSSFRHQDHFQTLVTFMTSNLSAITNVRETYFNELVSYRNNYIVNGIYDIVANDVLLDSGTDFISIKIDKYPEIEDEIKSVFNKLNINNVLLSILPDLLHYGSYPIKPVVVEGKGVIDLIDDLEPRQVISISDSKNLPLMYFVSNMLPTKQNNFNSSTTITESYSAAKKANYDYLAIDQLLYFSIDLNFQKMLLPEQSLTQFKRKAPTLAKKFLPPSLKIKTSQSFVWSVIDKLKEVLLLDKLSVYRDIGSILTPNLVGIPVPDVFDPNQLIEISKKYDELLNSNTVKLSNSQNLELTLQELASVKVVPIVGDKGQPQSIDIGRSAPISSADALNDSISRLLNSLGIPKELFDGATESKSNLKTNIRYAKKIKRIQKNITKTLVFLALLHISAKYPEMNVYSSDIVIQLKNNVNVDELENLESQDLMVASMGSVKTLLEDLEPIIARSSYEIDVDAVVENIIESFSSLGSKYSNIFVKRKEATGNVLTNEEGNHFNSEQDTIVSDPTKET